MSDAERARKAMDRLIADAQAREAEEAKKAELSDIDKLKQSLRKGFYDKYKKYGL